MAAVAVWTMLGLASVAYADTQSRLGYSYDRASVFFWLGLIFIFVPAAFRILMRGTKREERLALIVLLGVALYFVKVLGSPFAFTFVDEYIHLRSTQDILRTHHLFSNNPLLPTASYYPGLPALTSGLVDVSGLSPFVSGLLIIGLARVLLSVCFFLVAERVTGSDRGAAGASVIYAANPMFLFWSSSFSYENLALPLAAFAVWWLGRTRQPVSRPALAATAVAIAAVIVTHHIVGLALSALLGAWWLVERLSQRPSAAMRQLGLLAVAASAATLTWLFEVAKPGASYLFTNNILPALRQTGSLLTGQTAPRQLYSSGGFTSPTWQTIAGFAAVGAILLALPPAIVRAWRRRDHASIAVAVGVALLFPVSILPRLAPAGVAISARSWEFIFAGLGCVIGLLATDVTWRRHRIQTLPSSITTLPGWRRTAIATFLITVVFVGDVTIGTAFYEQLPESAHPSGYPLTVQPDVVTASDWARQNLGIDQRFGASALDAWALATYGEQDTLPEDSVWPIFFGSSMNAEVVGAIRATRVHYLFIDWRMTSRTPPIPNYYFSTQEPAALEYRVFPGADLRKFTSTTCAHVIYSSRPIQVIDVSRIANGSCTPGPTNTATGGATTATGGATST